MRKTLFAGLAFALVASSNLLAQASSTQPTNGTSVAPPSSSEVDSTKHATIHPMKVQGSVSSIDETAHTILVHPTSGPDLTLNLGDSTRYYLGKKTGKYSDLRVGSRVSLEYNSEDSINNASKVWVTNTPTVPPPSR